MLGSGCHNGRMSTVPPSPGYRGHPDWRDMSEYAVHFTKPAGLKSAYDVMTTILSEGRIIASGPWGAARKIPGLSLSQHSACFSEIPLDLLDRLVERRSKYGIGFRQDFLIKRGGGRVWYLDKDGVPAYNFNRQINTAVAGGVDPNDPLWALTPFVDFPGAYGASEFRFEWEREWRVPTTLHFAPTDAEFLFIPEAYHAAAKKFYLDLSWDYGGPVFLCPYIDPTWDIARIQKTLAPVPAASTP
jgi:hypothetical protein